MAEITRRGGRFTVEVKHNFGRPNEDLLDYLVGLEDKIRTQVIRKMVSAAGTTLAKEIRRQIKQRDMPYSRASNAEERKKLRKEGTKQLARTIGKRVWNKAKQGIIGVVVGPQWPEGAHGHLVEFGHKITGKARVKFQVTKKARGTYQGGDLATALQRGQARKKTVRIGRHKISRSGQRTIAHGFQADAYAAVERDIFYAMANAMSAALKKLGNPHIKARIIRQQREAPLPF